jgi:hypothetical protein
MAGGRFSGQGQHIEDLGKFFCNSLGCDIFHVKYVNVNSRANLPLHEVRVHFDRAGSQKVSVPVWLELDFCAFRLRRLAQSQGTPSGPRYFSCEFSRKCAFVRCPSAFRVPVALPRWRPNFLVCLPRLCAVQSTCNRRQ